MVVDACVTVTVTAGATLDVKLLSPEYTAMIELVATGRSLVARVATPLVSVSVPSEVVPLKNWTVPVGVSVLVPIAATVAVNVTDSPKTEELGEAVIVVVEVGVDATVMVTAGDVFDAKLVSPEYVAVIELAPVGSAEVARVATPLVRVSVPSEVVPLKN